MQLKLKANNLLEWVALTINLYPRPLCDTYVANTQSQCILTAAKCGIFTALLEQPKTLDALSKECKVDNNILSLVLQVLISCNYIVKRNDHYHIAKKMKKWFAKESSSSIQNNILLSELQLSILGQLDEIIKSGKSLDIHGTLTEKHHWQIYQAGMLESAKQIASSIKKKIPVKEKAKVLLDIGGSHGLLGAAICRANGIKKSMVLDLPEAIEFAIPLAKQEHIDDIVEFNAFNILEQSIDTTADVVLMSQFLHHFSEENVLDILRKVYDSLTANGTIVIIDFTADNQASNDSVLAANSLMFRLTSNSECYTIDNYQRFLHASGFADFKTKKLLAAPFSQLITARKHTSGFEAN